TAARRRAEPAPRDSGAEALLRETRTDEVKPARGARTRLPAEGASERMRRPADYQRTGGRMVGAINEAAEEAVSSEPVSAFKVFSANKEKYRELRLLAQDRAFDLFEKARYLKELQKLFPGGTIRENRAPYQGIEAKFEVRSGNSRKPLGYAKGGRNR